MKNWPSAQNTLKVIFSSNLQKFITGGSTKLNLQKFTTEDLIYKLKFTKISTPYNYIQTIRALWVHIICELYSGGQWGRKTVLSIVVLVMVFIVIL